MRRGLLSSRNRRPGRRHRRSTMRPNGIRLSGRHRLWFHGIFVVLFLSGALWWIFHNWVQVKGEFGPTPHPAEKWWLKLHGAAAMAALIVLGTLIPTHVKRGWRAQRYRTNGIFLVAVCLLLIGTGY